jgi:hypothetical protein
MDATVQSGRASARQSGMSYKFQRLREKIRRAIESGELAGKLPGERALARRFHVNAKTLSKALTDLAAEGILDRSIGRGTYVKGSAPAKPAAEGKWLVLCDAGQENCCTVEHLRTVGPELEILHSVDNARPSFLNQFGAVIDLASATQDAFLRDLLVRNVPVIALGREPKTYSVHAVLADVALGAARLGRDLLLAGHRRLAAVEPRGTAAVSHALRQAVGRYASDAIVESCDAAEVASLVESGVTAFVCDSAASASGAMAILRERGIDVPGQVSLTAVGCTCPAAGCSGYFVPCDQLVATAVQLLNESQPRPTTLWLPGTWIDRGTMAPTGTGLPLEAGTPLRVSGVLV